MTNLPANSAEKKDSPLKQLWVKIRDYRAKFGITVKKLIDPNFNQANEVIKKYWGNIGGWPSLKHPIFRIPINKIINEEITLKSLINIPYHYIFAEEKNIYKKENKEQEIQEWCKIIIKKQEEKAHIYKNWWDATTIPLYELTYNWETTFLDKEGLENFVKEVLWIVWFFWLHEEKK